jgi:hypothetical protein
MKYCPKCKKLYNDSDLVCTCEDCKSRVLKTIEDEQTSVFLCSGDVLERDRVQAALSDEGIPSVYTRHMVTGSSQVLTGMDMDGFDILVPYELYEKAYDVAVGIGAIKLEGCEIVDEEFPQQDEAEEMSDRKRTAVRVVSAILFIILVALVIFCTDFATGYIKSLFT